ncbi:hypothetical protein UNDKW_4347 [Undibacterium sp. KW1]|uniref:hypothetical protein n=1 Tax=Undibacterium sp. KW1 TaxID=2058624 RepID=UPI001331DB10|nr:hypothetical protein [Undibacterium sp. KW1]BBB62620.1 hypothetical protein UNDKW_4347 [Undibacterium sp. KW1]
MSNLTETFQKAADFFCGPAPGSTYVPFAFEVADRSSLPIRYSSYGVPGLTGDASDFVPTDAVSSFLQTSADVSWQNDPIGGGFGETRLSLLCGYGTGVRVVPDEEIDALIDVGTIDVLLKAPPHYLFRTALKDRYVFRVCSAAFQDGILFLASDEPDLRELGNPDLVGLYPLNMQQIQIATKRDPADILHTIKHELLHYVFDKSFNILGNVRHENPSLDPPSIAVDHFVIEVVMEKLQAQTLCKQGLITHLSKPMWSANTYRFTAKFDVPFLMEIEEKDAVLVKFVHATTFSVISFGGIDFPLLIERHRLAWDENDHIGIMSVLDDPDFASAAVAAQLIPLLPQPGFPELESIPLLFTPEMYQDMAFLHAQRYAMYVHGIYELSLISKRERKTMNILFANADISEGAMLRNFGWAARMDAFFTEFFEALITDPMEGVLAIERRLRKP